MGDTPLTGINSVEDLRAYRFASAAEFGIDRINDILVRDLQAVNRAMLDAVKLLAEPLTEQSRAYGTSYRIPMVESDEFGEARSKKAQPGITVSFPLKRYTQTLSWTRDAFKRMTPAEMAEKYIAARNGYNYEVIRQIKKAAYLKTNYTHVDELTNGVSLSIKRFLNADGQKIPDAPDGTSFNAATHNHYFAMTGTAAAAADVDFLVNHVTEHGNYNGVMIAVSAQDADQISAINGFKPALDAGLITPSPTSQSFAAVSAPSLGDDRLIGFWKNSSVAVYVKPWAVTGRWGCFATASGEKPLGYRQPRFAELQGFRFNSLEEKMSIVAQLMEAEFGFGANNRTAAAFLDVVNQGTWQDPTIP